MNFVYMMKCWLFSCGLLFLYMFFILLLLLLVIILVEKQLPLLQPDPSILFLSNWRTPKHLGLLLCTGPLLLLYNFSADAYTIYTAQYLWS